MNFLYGIESHLRLLVFVWVSKLRTNPQLPRGSKRLRRLFQLFDRKAPLILPTAFRHVSRFSVCPQMKATASWSNAVDENQLLPLLGGLSPCLLSITGAAEFAKGLLVPCRTTVGLSTSTIESDCLPAGLFFRFRIPPFPATLGTL